MSAQAPTSTLADRGLVRSLVFFHHIPILTQRVFYDSRLSLCQVRNPPFLPWPFPDTSFAESSSSTPKSQPTSTPPSGKTGTPATHAHPTSSSQTTTLLVPESAVEPSHDRALQLSSARRRLTRTRLLLRLGRIIPVGWIRLMLYEKRIRRLLCCMYMVEK